MTNKRVDLGRFKQHLREVLLFDDGMAIESEGTVYVRSLEGRNYTAGILADDGAIEHEVEFMGDINSAIDYFLSEREKRNHGASQ